LNERYGEQRENHARSGYDDAKRGGHAL